ncbi:guanylate-binding protein 7-like [Mercenaria mercenaria]|uniref:guanylate-binding protein 7-like n=1 Tax=Mercenaria mercenaria TaxID=6596 RepID=UPI00234FA81F|nr:guanylate-binding protein 7-like [Mercenaria mercenaria]
MPDNPIFHSPMILVSTVDGEMTHDQSTLDKLGEIEKPLNIVSVVGTLRTGKSFILNKLARHDPASDKSWFETGHTTKAVTKGIWVMCRPHPTQEDQVLVLLDTEGIDDPDKVNIEDDKNLFIFATLLSSTMVYNTRGNFNKTATDEFKFLNKIKTSIKVSGSEEDDSILDFFFPNFVLTSRDFSVETIKDDDTFLENNIELKQHKKVKKVFCSLLRNYISSIRAGESICLTSATISMAAEENKHVVQKASEIYEAEMQKRLHSYSQSEKGLVNYHKDSMQVAQEVLKSGLIIDDEQIYEKQAMFDKFKNIVKKDLEAKCLVILERLDTTKIQVKIKNRKYCTPTGFDDYVKDIDLLIQQFNREAGYMGSARMVLQEFLDKKVEEEETVYKMFLEAQGGQVAEGPEKRKIKRLSLLKEEDTNLLNEAEEVEELIRADIEMLQVNGLQNI